MTQFFLCDEVGVTEKFYTFFHEFLNVRWFCQLSPVTSYSTRILYAMSRKWSSRMVDSWHVGGAGGAVRRAGRRRGGSAVVEWRFNVSGEGRVAATVQGTYRNTILPHTYSSVQPARPYLVSFTYIIPRWWKLSTLNQRLNDLNTTHKIKHTRIL